MAFSLRSFPPSPSSLQIRLGDGSRKFSSVILRIRIHPTDRLIRLVCAARADGGRSHWGTNGHPRPDSFSGWSGHTETGGSKRKGGLGRLLVAGLVGVFLASGVTLTSLYLKSRTIAGVKQQMKPLTTERALLSSDDESAQVDSAGNGSYFALLDNESKMEDCNSENEKAYRLLRMMLNPATCVLIESMLDGW